MRCKTVQTTLAIGPSWERGYDLLPGGEKLKARRVPATLGGKVTGLGHGLGLSDIIAGLITGINRRFGLQEGFLYNKELQLFSL